MPTQHILQPVVCTAAVRPQVIEGKIVADYVKYFADESKRAGHASALVFPVSTGEVSGAVTVARERGLGLTVSAARTGIAGGAVPDGGILVSLERMNRVLGIRRGTDNEYFLRCQAGVLLTDVQKGISAGRFADAAAWPDSERDLLSQVGCGSYFYPPDPTETSASIGGTVACNASGAHTFLYGPTRPYINWIRVVLSDGRLLELERGTHRADPEGRFGLEAPDGSVCMVDLPTYPWPTTKNSGGYYSVPGMDLLDLFIGSEGTLGVVVEVEIRIVPAPEKSCAVMTFWEDEDQALDFTEALREERDTLGIEAIEYVDPRALAMLRRRREQLGRVSGIPECVPDSARCCIYLDVGASEETFEAKLGRLADIVRANGGVTEEAWAAVEKDERERLRIFRHALPETVNSTIADIRREYPTVTKLGTDMAVPGERLREMLHLYRKRLGETGLDYVIFGHIGDSHLHVNILPKNPEQYALGRHLYHEFADVVVGMGGSPAAEHGIGKLKTEFLRQMYGADGIDQMKAVKALFDPEFRLGVGTLFSAVDETSE